MIDFKFSNDGFERPKGSSKPKAIRKQIQGFKAIQAKDDFMLNFNKRLWEGKKGDWIIFNESNLRLEIVPDRRFKKVFEVVE